MGEVNHTAWARSAVGFIRERGLEREFQDWCGGWPCPVSSAASHPLPADVIALVIAGRRISEVMQSGDVSPDDRADVDAFDKALEAFASRVCWDDEGGTLPDAHGDNCTCDLTGEGTP